MAKQTFTVPYSQGRLKPYIGIFMSPGGYDGTQELDSATLFSVPVIEVGNIRKFTYSNPRPGGGKYRVFNQKQLGRMKEAYPGLPDYSLTLESVVYYKETLFEALNFGAADVGYQDKPLIVQIRQMAPGNIPERIWLFWSCWYTENPYDFEANPTDMLEVQTIELLTAGVYEGKAA